MKFNNWLDNQPSYSLISWLFIRGLALIYFAAFVSMAGQIEGLIGASGILPLNSLLELISQQYQEKRFVNLPTLFWLDCSDRMLSSVCVAGAVAAFLLLGGIFERTMLFVCFTLYLSIVTVGQEFTSFQWDALLLEAGSLALMLPWRSPIVLFLYRFLITRFMLMSGVVKIASGDPAWLKLTALNYHYQTQPLPSPLAYYAHWLPEWINKLCVAYVLVVELILPFFVFLPRRFRHYAAWNFIILESGIVLTGNYNFFNLLTILLCLFLFDDKQLEPLMPKQIAALSTRKQHQPGFIAQGIAGSWAAIVLLACALHLWMFHDRQAVVSSPFNHLVQFTSNFWLVNVYGPFAVMTKERPEIIVQGSDDGINWKDYPFKYKPGELDKKLSWNIPHQPRLDWQLWFAAMQTPYEGSWVVRFMHKLNEASPSVLALLAGNPFSEHPPAYVRARVYRYRFTTPDQRAASGHVWQRQFIREYWPQ